MGDSLSYLDYLLTIPITISIRYSYLLKLIHNSLSFVEGNHDGVWISNLN